MEIPVLKYCHEDFDVIVRTDDIQGAWERFQGRINYRNDWTQETTKTRTYCQYKASDGCSLVLYDPDRNELRDDVALATDLWPVIYETNKYHISIYFKNIDPENNPKVTHIRKEVEDFFFFDRDTDPNYGRMSGEVNFLNEPGLFRLGIEYDKEGKHKEAFFSFEVVSPKLDTKNDYHSILSAVNAEFENIVFRYFSLTMQQMGAGHQHSLEIWMQVFEHVIDDYLKNIDRIIKNPHSKVRTQTLFAHADRIKRWTPMMEEVYAEKEAEKRLEEHYFRYEVYDNTVNSMENRFVKYTLIQIGKQLDTVFSSILQRNLTEISDSYRSKWQSYQRAIQKYIKHPFFAAVGKFEGLKQESLVLQSRMGYQQIYKDWLKLRKGIDFYTGATNIGTLQIWEIYELWCFIKVKNMVLKLLRLDPKSPLIVEPNGSLIKYQQTLSKGKGADYRIVIRYPKIDETLVTEEDKVFAEQLQQHAGDTVSIHYQHTFSRLHEDDFDVRTMTTEQRPDIIINIKKADGMVLTYLLDAKYRVWSDKNLDHPDDWYDAQDPELELALHGADYPPASAINQMHRYRDAIYYGMADKDRPQSKEVIGGYILFPGRGDDESISKRFYSKSIEQVNIGAFPLLPNGKKAEDNDPEGPQLYAHLRTILLEQESSYSHVANAVPQRGLAYVDSMDKAAQKLTLVVRVKTQEQLDWIREHKWYNIPIQMVTNAPQILKARQIIFLLDNNVVAKTNIVKNKIDVWTKERLWHTENYYKEPSSENYFMIRLHNLEDCTISSQELKDHIVESNAKEPIFFVTI